MRKPLLRFQFMGALCTIATITATLQVHTQTQPRAQLLSPEPTTLQPPDAPAPKPTDNIEEEILGMLRLMGARAWRFDLSEFSDGEYLFRLFVGEYVAGEQVKNLTHNIMNAMNWRPRFPDPDNWSEFFAKNDPHLSDDGEKWLSFEELTSYSALLCGVS